MQEQGNFMKKLRAGQIPLGTGITFTDPTAVEALAALFDFVWIDMEHNALTLETVQMHLIATKGSNATPLVRVPWNDPVLIKPVLDIGAAGIIVPFVNTAEEAKRAVAACKYPPDGVRGFGPRRPAQYGQLGGPEFCKAANEAIIVIIQIEHIDAVRNLDSILAVEGVSAIVIGSNDLSGSLGLMGQPRHPDVLRVVETIIGKAAQAGKYPGIAIGNNADMLVEWAEKGAQWMMMGNDYTLMLQAAADIAGDIRNRTRHLAAHT
jgi:2-dehydro-3-deoxyglucarate aldolase/4-hydroxy-2-oxoheptanedioate aldolase